jgi:hypothetical protein
MLGILRFEVKLESCSLAMGWGRQISVNVQAPLGGFGAWVPWVPGACTFYLFGGYCTMGYYKWRNIVTSEILNI